MTLPSNRITAIIRARCCTYGNNHCGGIISHLAAMAVNKEGDTAPLIDDLEM